MTEDLILSAEREDRPVREITYDRLKHAIVVGDLPAGSRIVETEYAQRMHISRTPLREALRKLERDGLVEYQPRRGVLVRAFTLTDVEEIYTIRNCLEMLTLPAIIEKATEKDIAELRAILAKMDPLSEAGDAERLSPLARGFHARLTAISGLKRIITAIESQDEYVRRFSALSIAREQRRSLAHEEHHQMVDLVEKRDLEAFTELTRKHIERSKVTCLQALAAQNKLKKE